MSNDKRIGARIASLALLFLLISVRAHAAIAFVQEAVCSGSGSCTLTFPAGLTSGNQVLVLVSSADQTKSATLEGITASEVLVAGPADVGASFRLFGWCVAIGAADAADTTIIPTLTASGSSMRAASIEISGASCTEDGAEVTASDSASPYPSPNLTTASDGSILFGIIKSNSASDYAASTATTAVPVDGADITGGNDVGSALAGYQITTTAGAYALTWSSTASETSVLLVFAVKTAEAGGGTAAPPMHLLLGVGGV